jgi:hypothetical protein
VHSGTSQYALYFRDARLERRELEGSGMHPMADMTIEDQVTQRLPRVPSSGLEQAELARPPRASRPVFEPGVSEPGLFEGEPTDPGMGEPVIPGSTDPASSEDDEQT